MSLDYFHEEDAWFADKEADHMLDPVDYCPACGKCSFIGKAIYTDEGQCIECGHLVEE